MECFFIDTNVLIYALDSRHENKRTIARSIISQALENPHAHVVSTQILQEYFVTATKKMGISAEDCSEHIHYFTRMNLVTISVEIIQQAILLHRKHAFSFWDALVIQSAIFSECTHLYSEDLQHNQIIHGIRIINPFLVPHS